MQRVLWLLIFCSGAVHAQTCWDNANSKLNADAGVSAVSANKESLSSEVTKCLSNVLQDPATLNRAVDLLVAADSGLAFLRDIQFKFKTFEATDNAGTKQAHLGFSYSYAKSIDTAPMKQHCGEACTEAFDLRFSTQGNVAFDSDVNPRNFLESHLNFAWFRSSGGVKQLSPAEQSAYR
ncbi:MAG TPA: hypothetical protein VET48_05460, partial [Steroidobacteraceae bacterium]|nr:hypothetical protein [Steroidobacteraceae bacterium]